MHLHAGFFFWYPYLHALFLNQTTVQRSRALVHILYLKKKHTTHTTQRNSLVCIRLTAYGGPD